MSTSDWLPLIGVLCGGLITSISNYLFFHFKSGRDKRRSVALISQDLDCFAAACSEIVDEVNNYQSSGGHIGEPITKIPSLDPFNEAADARDLKPELLSEVLSLSLKIQLLQRSIDFLGDVADQEKMLDGAKEQSTILGYEACLLSRKLRRSQKIPQPDYSVLSDSFEERLLKANMKLAKKDV